jgi:hypothetical protein
MLMACGERRVRAQNNSTRVYRATLFSADANGQGSVSLHAAACDSALLMDFSRNVSMKTTAQRTVNTSGTRKTRV